MATFYILIFINSNINSNNYVCFQILLLSCNVLLQHDLRANGCILFYQVCEVFLELLHDHGLMYCISIAKFEGQDKDDQVLAHIGNFEAFPLGGHLLDQLASMMQNGLMIDDHNVQVKLFECHDLACNYSVVTRGAASALGNHICSWCKTTKSEASQVSEKYILETGDTIRSIMSKRYMSESLVRVSALLIYFHFFLK